MTRNSKIEPCPHCGEKPALFSFVDAPLGTFYFVACKTQDCKEKGMRTGVYTKPEIAFAKWNELCDERKGTKHED